MRLNKNEIIIRSFGRAGNVTTLAVFPSAVVCVCESQEAEYRKYYENLLVIPDGEDGSSPKKSNAVLRHTEGDVFLLDDDITALMYYPKDRELPPDEAEWFVNQGFSMAHDVRAGMWGINISGEPMKMKTFLPFSLVRPVYYGVGIVRDNIVYDEKQIVMADLDFYLEKLNRWRKVLRFNQYYFKRSDSKSGGIGISKIRRTEMEHTFGQRLVNKWGSGVLELSCNDKGEWRMKLKTPIHGA